MIQYFDYKNGGINFKILNLGCVEKHMDDHLKRTLEQHKLLNKVVSYTAVGLKKKIGDENSTHNFLKNTLGANILGIPCDGVILQNGMFAASEALDHKIWPDSIEISQILSYLTSHFYLYIDGEHSPNAQLLEVANFFGRQFPKLDANHDDLKWLAYFTAVQQIMKHFDVLKHHFENCEGERALKSFFANPLTTGYLYFWHAMMEAFDQNIRSYMAEMDSVTAMMFNLENFKSCIGNIENLPVSVQSFIRTREDCEEFKQSLTRFYCAYNSFVQEWFDPIRDIQQLLWMELKDVCAWETVYASVRFFTKKQIQIDEATLWREFNHLNVFLTTHLRAKWFVELSGHQKWAKYFQSLGDAAKQCEFLKMAQYLFAITGHIDHIDCLYDAMKRSGNWHMDENDDSEDSSQMMEPDTLKAIMLIHVNLKNFSGDDISFDENMLKKLNIQNE
jgi:hypothetical protein